MSLPTPYGNANKEIIPLLKGVPPPRTNFKGEFIQYRIFYDKRLVYEGPVTPVNGFPETTVFIWARHRDRVKCFFTLESWRRDRADIVWQSIALPMHTVQKNVRIKVVIPGIKPKTTSKQVVPAAVRNARRRVNAIRENRIPRRQAFPRSSTIRPSTETKTTADTDIVEGNNGGYFLSSSNSSYTSYSRSWTGVRTPNFGRLKKTQLPVNPHTVSITETIDSPGALLTLVPSTGIYFNRFRRFTSDYPAPPGISHLPYAQFKALRKLIEKAESNIAANLAQDFAQIGQTTRLIANTATRLRKSIVALKKGNIPGAIDQLWRGHMPRYRGKGPSIGKSVASNWLELQYGWKPLINDVRESMEALKRLNSSSSPLVRRVTASATVESTVTSPIMHRVITSSRAGTHTVVTQTRAKYVLRYKIDDKLKAFLAQTGFTNPINLGWEIVPFSFVVDWFLPIGPYLETLSSWDGLVFLEGSFSRFTRGSATSAVDFTGSANGINYEDRGRFRRQTILLNRERLTSFPTAQLPTSVKNGLASVTHATNALALLRAAFR
jgi:hypothetical protein